MDLLDALFQTGDISLIHNAISKLDIFNNAKSTTAFIDHSLKLVSTTTADDRAFGLHLLTLAAHHVHQSIFIENVSSWGQITLDIVRIQPKKPSTDDTSTTAHLLLAAAWQCLGALFHRVDQLFIQSNDSRNNSSNELPGIRRDASALVPKLVASLRFTNNNNNNNKKQQQQSDDTNTITSPNYYYSDGDEELCTLLQAIKTVPVAFRQHASLLQQHLHPLALLHGNKVAMQCVASLPAAASLADTDPATKWSSLAQSILKTIHSHVDVVVVGAIENNSNCKKFGGSSDDDGDIASIAKQAIDPASIPLLPPPPSSTGSYTSSQLTSSLSIALHSVHLLDILLTQPFNVAVPVPSTAIVLLVTRIVAAINTKRMKMMLVKDGASSSSSFGGGGGGVMTRQAVYMGMVEMKISALVVLGHLIDVTGTTLTPLFGHVGRLLTDCLDTHIITSSSGGRNTRLEDQLLTTCKVCVYSAGLGGVRTLGSVLLKGIEMILYGHVAATTTTTGDGDGNKKKKSKGSGQQPPPQKKARIATTTIYKATHASSSITTQIAALQALEALLSIPGGGLTHHQRSRADALSLHLSLTTHSATSSLLINSHIKPLQIAAYQCLLASILCTAAPYRPVYLPQAMQLFASGIHDSWQPLAIVCAHGVVCCEAFLHPRSQVQLGKYSVGGGSGGSGSKSLLLSSMIDHHHHDDKESGFVEFGMPLFWQNNSNGDDDDDDDDDDGLLSEQLKEEGTIAKKKGQDRKEEEEEEAHAKEDKGRQSKHQPPGGKPKAQQVTSIAVTTKLPSLLTAKATTTVPMRVDHNDEDDSDMEDSDGPLPDIDSGDESDSD